MLSVVDNPSASYQWSIDGNKLVGATDASITAFIEGNYTVDVISAGCGGVSSPVTVAFDDVNAVSPTIGVFSVSPEVLQANEQGVGYTYQWYVDYKGRRLAIVGATAATYIPIYNGVYYVSINSAGNYCTRISGSRTVSSQASMISNVRLSTTNTSIYIPVDGVSTSSIDVIPNPALDDFNVYYRSGSIGDIKVDLIDMNGSLMVEMNVSKPTYEIIIPVENLDRRLNAGIYIVRVTEGNLVEYTKVVVE